MKVLLSQMASRSRNETWCSGQKAAKMVKMWQKQQEEVMKVCLRCKNVEIQVSEGGKNRQKAAIKFKLKVAKMVKKQKKW